MHAFPPPSTCLLPGQFWFAPRSPRDPPPFVHGESSNPPTLPRSLSAITAFHQLYSLSWNFPRTLVTLPRSSVPPDSLGSASIPPTGILLGMYYRSLCAFYLLFVLGPIFFSPGPKDPPEFSQGRLPASPHRYPHEDLNSPLSAPTPFL